METSEPPNADVPMAAGAKEHLLPGEEPDSVYVDDAVHWISVYQELLGARHQLLEDLDRGVADSSPEAQRGLDEVDWPALAEQQQQHLRRLAFWRGRLQSLQGNRP